MLIGGWKLVSIGLCVFSGSFGVRSIVLCKCSDKYIDIYFILKITFASLLLIEWNGICISDQRPSAGTSKVIQRSTFNRQTSQLNINIRTGYYNKILIIFNCKSFQ